MPTRFAAVAAFFASSTWRPTSGALHLGIELAGVPISVEACGRDSGWPRRPRSRQRRHRSQVRAPPPGHDRPIVPELAPDRFVFPIPDFF